MKKTLLLSLLCMILAMPAMAQPGYRYGRGYNPRIQTVGRHGNEYIAWHSYYVGLRVGLNASHVSSESPLLDGSYFYLGNSIFGRHAPPAIRGNRRLRGTQQYLRKPKGRQE